MTQKRHGISGTWVVFAMYPFHDLYGVARMSVPYRPKLDFADGLDCKSVDDVFKLYWRYTNQERMGYMSTTRRKLQGGGTHAEKFMTEFVMRKGRTLLLPRGVALPTWVKDDLVPRVKQAGEVETIMPSRSTPNAINPERCTYLELQAWRMVYAYLQKFEWPAAQMGLRIWSPVGQGRDVNRRAADAKRPGTVVETIGPDTKRKVAAARVLTPEEEQLIRDGELTANMLDAQGVSLNRRAKLAMLQAQEHAKLHGRGIWGRTDPKEWPNV